MKVAKTLFFLPSLLSNACAAHLLPRWGFLKIYEPSSEMMREVEQEARNAARLAAYKAKRMIYR